MEEMSRRGRVGMASMKAGMDRKTGRKYLKSGKMPSELRQPHTWRTRVDPFELDWPQMVKRLRDAPELEAKSQIADARIQHGTRKIPRSRLIYRENSVGRNWGSYAGQDTM